MSSPSIESENRRRGPAEEEAEVAELTTTPAEWTVVHRASRGRRQRRQPAKHRAPDLPPAGALPTPDYTSDDILQDRQRIRARFRDSSCYRRLEKRINDILDAGSQAVAGITHAICLGTGSFVPNLLRYEAMRTTHVQLDAFLAIVELLADRNGKPVKCIFQEPAYTPADVAFLEGLGHSVVKSPEGFQMVDNRCLVYGIHLYRDVYAKVIERSFPAMYVGTDWESWDIGMKHDWKASSDRLKEMDKTFDKAAFPHDDEGLHAFNDTSIYWRRQHDENGTKPAKSRGQHQEAPSQAPKDV